MLLFYFRKNSEISDKIAFFVMIRVCTPLSVCLLCDQFGIKFFECLLYF